MTWTSWRQYANDHPRVVDVALIGLLMLAESGTATLNSNLPSAIGTLGWASAFPLALAASLALLWRRSHPRTVVLVTALCVAAAVGIGYLGHAREPGTADDRALRTGCARAR